MGVGEGLMQRSKFRGRGQPGGGRSGVTCMFLVVTILCSFPSSIKRQEYYIVYTKFVSTQLKGNVLTLSLRQVVIEQ